jgi:multiple sugar transport system substrate-binding protein
MRNITKDARTRGGRATVLLAAAVALAVALAGCGDGGGIEEGLGDTDGQAGDGTVGEEGAATSSAPEGRETVTFAAAMFAESGRGPLLQAMLDDFNDSQEDYFVEPASIPFSSFGPTIFTQMGGGAGPDLIRFDHTDFYAAIEADLLAPLDEYIDEDAYDFLPPDRYTQVDGTRYGVIFELSNYVLLYNPEILEGDVPESFEEFLEVAEASTDGERFGFAFRHTQAEQAGMWQDVSNFVFGHGGRWSDGENLTIDSPEVIEAVEAYKRVYDAGVIPEGADAATYRRMYAEGLIAMMIDNGGVPPILHGQNEDIPIDAAPSPFSADEQGLIVTPLALNANSDHPEAAVAFIEWLLQEENQAALQEVLGASSPATEVPRSEAQLAAHPYAPVYDSRTDYAVAQVVEGFETRTPDIRQIVIDSVLRVLQGAAEPHEAMQQAQQQAEAAVN